MSFSKVYSASSLAKDIAIGILVVSVLFIVWINSRGINSRALPRNKASGPVVMRAASQRDIYIIYKAAGLHGARVVHLNRFLNMVDYMPREENITVPFPIKVTDVRPLYERGIDSHNWLFIANKTGMARSVIIILPDNIWKQRHSEFETDLAHNAAGGVISGYSQDMPLMITTLDSVPQTHEPVIVNVDAGYFGWDEAPAAVIARLKEKFPDIRMIVVSESIDEPEITNLSRERLRFFTEMWTAVK